MKLGPLFLDIWEDMATLLKVPPVEFMTLKSQARSHSIATGMDLSTFTLQILMKLALLFLGYVEDMVTHQKALLATAFHTSCVDEMMETLHFIVPTIMVDHFYTTDTNEMASATSPNGWTFEGIACYVGRS